MSSSEENTNKINNLSSERQYSYQRMIEEINQLTANADDLTSFYNAIVNSVQRVSDYYSVNLFIVDSERRWAVLKSGTGDVIQSAIQHGHKLAIDEQSMVSRVINTHYTGIAAIKPEQPPIPYPSVELPPVHSELCVPLISRQNNVIGVLDIQSEEYDAFQEDDAIIFEALANYMAIQLEDTKYFK